MEEAAEVEAVEVPKVEATNQEAVVATELLPSQPHPKRWDSAKT